MTRPGPGRIRQAKSSRGRQTRIGYARTVGSGVTTAKLPLRHAVVLFWSDQSRAASAISSSGCPCGDQENS